MSDLSDDEAIEWDRGNPARRCVAHKKNGQQCRRWAIRGGTVCTHHGGRAPAVKAKARQRLDEAADRMARALLDIAISAESESVRLAATRDALDRSGITAKSAAELPREPQAWEVLLADVAFGGVGWGITRAEHLGRYEVLPEEQPSSPMQKTEVLDAEFVAAPGAPEGLERALHSSADEVRALDRPDLPGADSASSTAPVALPPVSVNYEDVPAVMRASRARMVPVRRTRRRH